MSRVVCAIPALNEQETIAHVAEMASRGLAALGAEGHILLGDNGSTDATAQMFLDAPGTYPKSVVSVPTRGKGHVLFQLMQTAVDLDADCIAFFDADVISGEEFWVGALVRACLEQGADLALPEYLTSQGGPLTNIVVRPMVYHLTARDVPQPTGGEMCLSRSFAMKLLDQGLPAAAAGYGSDVHITLNALGGGRRVSVVKLGVKRHRPRHWSSIQNIVDEVFCELRRFFQERGANHGTAEVLRVGVDQALPELPARNIPDPESLQQAALRATNELRITAFPESPQSVALRLLADEASTAAGDPDWLADALVRLLTETDAEMTQLLGTLEVIFLNACANLAVRYEHDDDAAANTASALFQALDGAPSDGAA